MYTAEDRIINRSILRLAAPAVLSNIAVPLLGLCDTFITGHLGAEVYLAAIAVGTIMVNSTYWLFGFLRAGTSGLTAEAVGRGDQELQRNILTLSLVIALGIGVAITAVSYPLSGLLLKVVDAPAETAALAREYFLITTLAASPLLATMSVTGWMIGKQNTTYPMATAISVNALNIALSFGMVYGLGWGFKGVALGTMTANWLGLALALLLARRLQHGRLLAPLKRLSRRVDMSRFFKVNTNLLLRSACIMAVTYGMTAFASRMGGDATLAVNAVLMQLFLLFSFFMDGFAYAAEAICGKYHGAADHRMLRRSIAWLAGWGGATTLAFAAIYLTGAGGIAGLLTDTTTVTARVADMRWLCAAIPLCSGAAFVLDGIYIGLTDTRRMLIATFTAAMIFYACAIIGTGQPPARAYSILWAGFNLFLLTRSILLALWLAPAIHLNTNQ